MKYTLMIIKKKSLPGLIARLFSRKFETHTFFGRDYFIAEKLENLDTLAQGSGITQFIDKTVKYTLKEDRNFVYATLRTQYPNYFDSVAIGLAKLQEKLPALEEDDSDDYLVINSHSYSVRYAGVAEFNDDIRKRVRSDLKELIEEAYKTKELAEEFGLNISKFPKVFNTRINFVEEKRIVY